LRNRWIPDLLRFIRKDIPVVTVMNAIDSKYRIN
jgi:GTPase SAR1 family protein